MAMTSEQARAAGQRPKISAVEEEQMINGQVPA